MNDTPAPADSPKVEKKASSVDSNVIFIRLWPKTPLFYPLAILALICAIFTPADPSTAPERVHLMAVIFLAAFLFTLFVVTIDVGLTWALLGVAIVVIIGLTAAIVNIYHPFLKNMVPFLESFTPAANRSFYYSIFVIWLLLMGIAFIHSRFHYVRVEPNEVVVVGGVLDKRKRYPTLGLRYTKEIVDVFEYYLPFVSSGRLVLRFNQEDEALVLDHVLNIEATVKRMENITGVMQVAPATRG